MTAKDYDEFEKDSHEFLQKDLSLLDNVNSVRAHGIHLVKLILRLKDDRGYSLFLKDYLSHLNGYLEDYASGKIRDFRYKEAVMYIF